MAMWCRSTGLFPSLAVTAWCGSYRCQTFDVRRVFPWALVGLVATASAAGAWFGVNASPISSAGPTLVEQIIRATRSTGTALFAYSQMRTSPNPLLNSSTHGTGAVNFRTLSVSTSESDRSTNLSSTNGSPERPVVQTQTNAQIWIGRTTYIRLSAPNQFLGGQWSSGVTFPANSFGPLGALTDVSPIDSLANDETIPNLQVEDLGDTQLDGVTAARYELIAQQCSIASGKDGYDYPGPLEVWVDSSDRLLKAKESNQESVSVHQLGAIAARFPDAGALAGRSTIVSTVRLSDFGKALSISVPARSVTLGGSSSGSGFTIRSRNACPP